MDTMSPLFGFSAILQQNETSISPLLEKMRMSVTGALQSKSVKKYVLQQSNCNVDISQDKEEDKKPLEKNIFPPKIKEDMAFETENQFSPLKADKGTKSEAKKLRNIRLDLSSLKRGAIKETNVKLNDSSEESSEDELKKTKKITRPVVPNYVTNTERGPCRKPRQSRPDQLSFSSQNSPKISSQILSIERRNERERNRVKLVNEGFASLQDRIPDFISEAYNEEKRKKNAKKLSKVDTLRMAVDYIRHLETLLNLKSTEKAEDQWDHATPGEYPSPKYQPSCVDSPGTSFEQTYDQDRIFYAYDLNFESQKETLASGEEPVTLVILKSPNSYVEEDFQYYETFNSIKKENSKDVKEKISEKEEGDVKNLDATERDPESLPKDVIKMAAKESMVLPLNNEPFAMSDGITIYF